VIELNLTVHCSFWRPDFGQAVSRLHGEIRHDTQLRALAPREFPTRPSATVALVMDLAPAANLDAAHRHLARRSF
jgi:hypothetical protein